MIHDARVLQDDFLPREVVHRHDEMNHLAGALEPVVEGDKPQHALLTGPSGAGKTCIARYSLNQLEEQLLDIDTTYVDCWQRSTRFRVLSGLLDGVGKAHSIQRTMPHDELLVRLESLDHPYIVVLDEVDQLRDLELLRELYGIPQLTMVLVTNNKRDVFSTVDERLQSRLRSAVTVRFDRYAQDELVSILQDRVEWGLEPGTISTDQLAYIADIAAGNARDAISILRNAARAAERSGSDTISDEILREAVPEARAELRQKSVEKLTEHQRVVYGIVADAGPLSPGEIHDRYESAVDDPKTQRTTRKYLRKLVEYNLVETSGEGPSRIYRTTGG